MATRSGNVFTIPASAPFLPTLARALLDGELVPGFAPRGDPLALATVTVYLPTRRAAGAFGQAILGAAGVEALLLPRIVPLGDVDEDTLSFADAQAPVEHPAAATAAERRLVLAQLVQKFVEVKARSGGAPVAATPGAALLLAGELARLFDDLTTAQVPFEIIAKDFVPAEYDGHWQESVEFLQFARDAWKNHLQERRLADPTERRDILLAREAGRLSTSRTGPVIAAGSTGTIPAVAGLIAAIAKLPDGAVVLPGLDLALDAASFALISGGAQEGDDGEASPGHPQFGLKRLLGRLEIDRDRVRVLGSPAPHGRDRLLSEALRPAASSERWRTEAPIADSAIAGLSVIEAADPREEALALAIALREVLEHPDRRAALVTPDRTLARRVAAELRRWKMEVDDSAGVALADSDAGRFGRLVVQAAAERFAPIPLLAFLRHPLARTFTGTNAVDALEIAVLRGPRPAEGAENLAHAVTDVRERAVANRLHQRDPRMKLAAHDWDAALDLARRCGEALAPLLDLACPKALPLAALLSAHRQTLDRLCLDVSSQDGDALMAVFETFDGIADAPTLDLSGYADAFAQLLAGEAPVRPPFDPDARIRILGPLEARLLDVDLVLLGGLNEGTWPSQAHVDAWLNRPMRKKLGLDLPERRIGLSAHDFAQALGAPEVIVSRARKQNGVETVASRFLQRLAAVAPEGAWNDAKARGRRFASLAERWQRPERTEPVPRPEPRPPAEARPTRLSVTEIETLIRDPYSIYARHVLGLEPLDPIDADPGAAERGTVLHEAFDGFAKDFPERLPQNAFEELRERGRNAFKAIERFPGLRAVWWPRFERAARWFIGEEPERRADVVRTLAEISGRLRFPAGESEFTLTARADRIDLRKDGAIAIADYKSGQAPTLNQVLAGLAPQLALEAAIAQAGGFEGIAENTRIVSIHVIRISGGHPPGEWRPIDPALAKGKLLARAQALGIDDVESLARVSREKLEALIRAFAAPDAPYQSIPRPKWRGRFGQYDHLARIREWSADEGGAE